MQLFLFELQFLFKIKPPFEHEKNRIFNYPVITRLPASCSNEGHSEALCPIAWLDIGYFCSFANTKSGQLAGFVEQIMRKHFQHHLKSWIKAVFLLNEKQLPTFAYEQVQINLNKLHCLNVFRFEFSFFFFTKNLKVIFWAFH